MPDVLIPREQIDWRVKGLWWPGPAVALEEYLAARHDLFDGTLTWPVMVARLPAIEHDVAVLAAFCARHGLEFAPHGKTTMAPGLSAAQLRAGAWGITAAIANQVLAYHAFGLRRIPLANELVDAAPLRWLAGAIEDGLDFLCYADSLDGVRLMSDALSGASGSRPLRVLAAYLAERVRDQPVCRRIEMALAVGSYAVSVPRDWEGFPSRDELALNGTAADQVTR